MTEIPRKGLKTSGRELAQIPRRPYGAAADLPQTPALLHLLEGGHRYDLLWMPQPRARRLFVMLSGDAMRKKYDPPVFQRWKWAPMLPGHCLYIADPSTYLHPRLGLSWYAGTVSYDPQAVIARLVGEIARQHDVPPGNVITYGSSGGGFAALRLAAALPDAIAVPINPQVTITDYEMRNVETYLDIAFGTRERALALELYPRLSLRAEHATLQKRRIIYIQNRLDTHHHEAHYKPFCDMMEADPEAEPECGRFRRLLFEHEGGHGAAESQEVFDRAMAIIAGWTRD
jgi:hypothetical protein